MQRFIKEFKFTFLLCLYLFRYHLQALRHFYVLATEPRLLLPKDIDTRKYCYARIRLTFKSYSQNKGQKVVLKAPCLVPQLDRLSKIEFDDDRYWKITFDKDRNFDQLKRILNANCVLFVKQRAGCLSHMEDPQVCILFFYNNCSSFING